MTVQVMWMVPVWELTIQLPQQTVIIKIASQGVSAVCSSFQSSHLIVTVGIRSFGYKVVSIQVEVVSSHM